MEKLLISACLLGVASRYDGNSKPVITDDLLSRLQEKYELVPFCPEIYGGLPTPRAPSERVGERVLMRDGRDVTENYIRGAEEALALCKKLGVKRALLKEKSPSCGVRGIYDGSFTGTLVSGLGVTAELLIDSGLLVVGESETDKLF